jgi:hypothetical protein
MSTDNQSIISSQSRMPKTTSSEPKQEAADTGSCPKRLSNVDYALYYSKGWQLYRRNGKHNNIINPNPDFRYSKRDIKGAEESGNRYQVLSNAPVKR